MEDYEIRDVMNRVKHPRLEPKISYVVDRRQERNARNRAYQLLLSLVNSGSIRAIDVKFVMEFPAQMVADVGAAFERRRLRADSRRYPTEEFSFKKPSFVVFPDDEWRPSDYDPYRFIYRVDDAIHEFISHESPVLKWKVFADDMPPRSGEVPLKELNDF